MLTKSICVYRNHLCMTGLWFSPYGVIPFAERIPLSTEQPDGNIGSERNEVIEAAIGEAKEAIMAKNSKEIVKASVESLVIRARAGDQNAMGMLASIQKAAKEGNEKAKVFKAPINKKVRLRRTFYISNRSSFTVFSTSFTPLNCGYTLMLLSRRL